ncbi:hypothetical protein BJ322DRAFT_850021 [Thelephora terrestris]|uniref:Uncharacterized protein n=1 Tax=Thelephora terrestris TaxID=56493 RepID=A0A9P6HEZ7_9AGAM|nr:hypothetical protein BJ322DRAFT_850021 [Thelephora terrestris]
MGTFTQLRTQIGFDRPRSSTRREEKRREVNRKRWYLDRLRFSPAEPGLAKSRIREVQVHSSGSDRHINKRKAALTCTIPPLPPHADRAIHHLTMATVAPPQRPSSRDAGLHLIRELNLNGERQFGFPTPFTGHELMEMWPALAPQMPDLRSSTYFRSQERAFFSRENSFFRFRVPIDIDAPYTQGGSIKQEKGKARAEPPQLSVIPRPHHQQQHHSQYPYPPPELRHKSPTIIEDDAWRRPTPYSERRRAGKAPRRKCD